jgi:hypothetical protein
MVSHAFAAEATLLAVVGAVARLQVRRLLTFHSPREEEAEDKKS